MIDFIFQGGIDERFTDWEEARNFVVIDAIGNNPRLSNDTKRKLQDAETKAYEDNAGKFLLSETEEIGRYYNQLRNTFPSITDDQRFLAIFEAADEVKAGQSSVTSEDIKDIKIPAGVKIGLLALGAFLIFRK